MPFFSLRISVTVAARGCWNGRRRPAERMGCGASKATPLLREKMDVDCRERSSEDALAYFSPKFAHLIELNVSSCKVACPIPPDPTLPQPYPTLP